jgi:microcystin-dependent protein
MRSRTPVGAGKGPGLSQVLLGSIRGAESRLLTLATLPAHIHEATFEAEGGLQASTADGESASPSSTSFLGTMKTGGMSTPPSLYTTTGSKLTPIQGLSIDGGIEIGATGGSQPFGIVPPQLGLLYCIAGQGMFPPRP